MNENEDTQTELSEISRSSESTDEVEVVIQPAELKKSNSIASSKSFTSFQNGCSPLTVYELPYEMLLNIFCKLNANDVLKTRGVCQEWKSIADSDQIWKSLYHYRYKSRNHREAPTLTIRESSGSSANFLRDHTDHEDSDSDEDRWDKSPFESWKSYYYRKMIEVYPSRFRTRPQHSSIKEHSQSRPQNTSFLFYLIGHIFLLLFTISTVFKVAGIFKGTYWSYSIFVSFSVVLFGSACDYKFLWVPETRLPWTKKMKIASFLCWVAFAGLIVLFAFSCDGLFPWGVSLTIAQLVSFACFCLFVTERMTRAPRGTNSKNAVVFSVLIFGMFVSSLAVLSAMRAKLAGSEDDRKDTSWLTVGLPVFVFSLLATFIGTRTLLSYFKEGANKEWVEPYGVMMIGALLLSTFFLLMDMAEEGDVIYPAASAPVFIAHCALFIYYQHKCRAKLALKWESFFAVFRPTAT
eukprot:CAMPEP_0168557800 /NCGR_PEP_ID=MMETSP0413-20121227/9624_1 /TAXON_ID=136452 /ORGANISM="Filamoeba nolandi, Strain NC-AS-23-1" /LENGTH=463 /DNA_ID=CAMNT_0008588867 /DNA_START=37 /DNA_END=1428 /DNA_ORIENTATION=+